MAPDRAALYALASFDEQLPEVPGDPAATLALLDEAGSPATVASTGGRYFGFVIGGSLPVAVAANWLATAWDQNTALPVMSPVAARLHEVVTGWLTGLLDLPSSTAAVFVTGSAIANTAALTAARDQQRARLGWDVQANGLFGAPELTVVIGENAHITLVRALGVVGLGRERVIRVPADDQGRMRADLGDGTGIRPHFQSCHDWFHAGRPLSPNLDGPRAGQRRAAGRRTAAGPAQKAIAQSQPARVSFGQHSRMPTPHACYGTGGWR